jgi:predicted O-methyltransferase YrrM
MTNFDFRVFVESDDVSNLNQIIEKTNEKMEGNILYRHHSAFVPHQENKEDARYNLYFLAKHSSRLVEVGFNGGHSAALFFYANPELRLLSFDLCNHRYAELCLAYLKTKYNIAFIKGDSQQTIPEYQNDSKYDMIHIDGGHDNKACNSDIVNCKMFADEHSFLVVDDAYLQGINEVIKNLIDTEIIAEIDYENHGLKKTNQHRIFKYKM